MVVENASIDASSSNRSVFCSTALLKKGFLSVSKAKEMVKPLLMSGASMTSSCVHV